MSQLIRFSILCILTLFGLSTTAPSAKSEDAVALPVAVKETKFLLEDANRLEKARTELCVSLLASIQQKGQTQFDILTAISVLGKLRYEPSIDFTVSQIGVRNVTLHRQKRLTYVIINHDPNIPTPYNFPAIQALIDHGPAAVPPLVKAYIARRKELAEKPQEEPDVVLRNIEFTLYQLDNSENALLYLKRAIEGVRLKDVLGVEVEAMVELRVRIQEEVKRRR